MTLDKFTIKAQEAIQQAVNTAQMNGQQVIEPVHILKGMMEKAKDVVTFIFQKLGVNAQQIEMLVEQEIKHLPRVQGGQPYLSNDSNNVLVRAQEIAQKQGDEFVSVEPVLLALLSVNSTASRIMKDVGCTEKDMQKAIQELRQGQKVQSQSADDNYQSLDAACCRSSLAVRRTILYLLVNQVQVRPPSSKVSQVVSSVVTCLRT